MSITETLIFVGTLCAAVAAIWALVEKIAKPIKEINQKIDAFQSWQKRQQEDIETSKEEREILCRGFRALCMWAFDTGANGEIKQTFEELNDFISKNSHRGQSYLKKGG